ncbi:2-oxoglutarate dehydrogenase, E2 component, dihydrolipoamide succinyltransferase [Corynebacterium otitidis]|uniref:Dihydrolipoamide acetyltransferase component of pyruvate dehydrogenase complex n=1 Tax=Corynebacterium otitidis ATCC 51513 TaxID=883169 RepID=I7JVK2_9CORY|nr:2-oxoglutarate dehydrogenase, E2 component, dihydrolipoamide succinyltransferase [Corynebacterium otitidis]EJZ82800.1 2-oxoglutarate dehydrogenase, E2 component, dihydrolipoamide succinyltransferase [Corynebacterium otitidis ATCC 51513]KKO84463.1 pyruvate dehydrogenase [Corynebacterium otitidis]CCI82981.1 dihydrolipoamide acetyltransferase [Corynebacterium otitidis ATCC 51513]
MAFSVEMPELGESVTEGTVTQWLKEVGDTVEADEPLLEVSTDKVDTEVPSPASGVLLEIKVEEDDEVEVGAVIAVLGEEGETPDSDDSSGSDSATDEGDSGETEDASSEEKADEEEPKKDEPKGEKQSSGSSSEVAMPELGESVTEGTVTQWLKEVGDTVEADEPLLEVSTDKVDTEVPSPASGVLLEILVEEDEEVEVGAPIARIGDKDAAPASSDDSGDEDDSDAKQDEDAAEEKKAEPKQAEDEKPAEEEEKDSEPAEQPAEEKKAEPKQAEKKEEASSSGSKPYVTPLVRKLARKHDVDLDAVEGTGVGGRIRKQDVLAAAEGEPAKASGSGEEKKAGGPSTKRVDPEKAKLRGTEQKANRIRQVTARKTVEALQTSAQLTQVHEVDVTRVAELRARSKKAFQDKHGAKLTYLPFFAKAVVEALVSHPNVNASYDAETKVITYHPGVNLSIAVDTERGLISPVIKNAEKLSVAGLAKAIADLAERARSNKLKPDDLSGGTFTLTNIGSEGALIDTPILVPPQAGILGTGAIVKRPVVVSEDGIDSIAIRQIAYLPFTYDHQLVDGADAGRFLTTIKDRLETAAFDDELEL